MVATSPYVMIKKKNNRKKNIAPYCSCDVIHDTEVQFIDNAYTMFLAKTYTVAS